MLGCLQSGLPVSVHALCSQQLGRVYMTSSGHLDSFTLQAYTPVTGLIIMSRLCIVVKD